MPFFSYLNDKSDITDILFRKPSRYGHINNFTQEMLRGRSELSVGERELIAAFVSALNACNYCAGIHTAVASRFGIESTLIEELLEDIDQANVSEKMKPILKFSKKLTLKPAKMQEADAKAVFDAAWSEQTLEDVIGIIALFNYYNRILEGHGIKGYPEIFETGANHLSKRGYKFPAIVAKILLWRKKR